jgi:ABC-type transport system substrate-binding protein
MKRFAWRWFVINSARGLSLAAALLGSALLAGAETRPQYGGTLHIAMHAAPTSLDPADQNQTDSFARRSLTQLMFDTLVAADRNGRIQASLAESWQASDGGQRWQFRLRRGVKFDDGTPLTAEIAAASLRIANRSWKVSVEGDSVIIEPGAGDPELLTELALARNAIVKRNVDGKIGGTGAFHVVDWQPAKKLTLAAEENCWRGRPFLDSIEIEMGKSYRDQAMALESGRADMIEVPAEQAHRAVLEGRSVISSLPVELLALVFHTDAASPTDKALREALALSVERSSMRNVLLQGAGQPAGGILPTWMSGYGFVFPTEADLARAQHDREQVRNISAWSLGYDVSDPLARLLAERVVLNARDARLTVQPASTASPDLKLIRIPLVSADPWIALDNAAVSAGLPAMKSKTGSIEELYAAERASLATQRMIPLFHLPASYAATPALRNWTVQADGSLDLTSAWLRSNQPLSNQP